MSDHGPACHIRRELTEHRDGTYADWGTARRVLNFAAIVADRACPDYHPTTIPADERDAT